MKSIERLLAAALAGMLLTACNKDNPGDVPVDPPTPKKGIPTLSINTPGGVKITSKNTWVKDAAVYYTPVGGEYQKLGDVSIKGRGNTTWSFPKKPYAIKFNEKGEYLGMPKGDRFDLIANYIDITDMRNVIALEIGRRTKGLEWTPRCEYVELYMNGAHQGNYVFTEHIKIGKRRLDLKEGGYLLELDVNYDEDYKFHSDLLNLPVMIKDYEGGEIDDKVLERIKKEFNELEAMVVSEDRTVNGWQNHIDMDSFIDWWFVYELAQCGEPNAPKSSYMYRDAGGKLKAGPVWDFDWGTFRNGYWVERFRLKDCIWLSYMFKDPSFVKRVKEKWEESRDDFKDVAEFIDETAEHVKQSAKNDKIMWPMTTKENEDETLSFEDAVARLKTGYLRHWEWIDKAISKM